MISILVLGFLIGMRHALDADHLAAVASMATRHRGMRSAAWRGAIWGLGHTLTLFLIGGVCLLLNTEMPATLVRAADLAVGAMLVFLGAEVFWRMRRQGVHLHAHSHQDGVVHIHAHAHPPQTEHGADDAHQHRHRDRFPRRALIVGLVHGMAGSAALLLVTLGATGSTGLGLAYIAVFGVGSILGMAALSGMLAIPLHVSTGLVQRLHVGLQTAIGGFTVGLGLWMLAQAAGI
ncbi:MAG TPA: urease accessory protein [Thermoanaerobaculia bacterium]|nr:urease accessory protein [Thermoanaerobaculia bacterium]